MTPQAHTAYFELLDSHIPGPVLIPSAPKPRRKPSALRRLAARLARLRRAMPRHLFPGWRSKW